MCEVESWRPGSRRRRGEIQNPDRSRTAKARALPFPSLSPSPSPHDIGTAMAASLQRTGLSLVRRALACPTSVSHTRSLASESDALVEIKPGEIGIVSGVPEGHLRRRVIIYSPARTATQQGSGKVGKWKINFVSTQKWENPLMGWTSTGDPYANVGDAGLTFDSEEAAKAFAEKFGWDYVVRKRHTPLLKPKAYADNFKWKSPPKTEGA